MAAADLADLIVPRMFLDGPAKARKRAPPHSAARRWPGSRIMISRAWVIRGSFDESHSLAPLSMGDGAHCFGIGTSSGLQTSGSAACASAAGGHSQSTAPAGCDPLGSIHRKSLVPPDGHR